MRNEEKRRILDAQILRGAEAEKLWENALLQETFGAMERDILSTMKKLKPDDMEGRDVCWRELRSLERFRNKFKMYIHTGKAAEKSLMQVLRDKF